MAKGTYIDGERRGQLCVTKWFKTGVVFEKEFFELDIKAVAKAMEIIERFNPRIANKSIKINVAEVWTFTGGGPGTAMPRGAKSLTEPFIQNYQKFNSNTGWNDDRNDWAKVMQALSHFSYHCTLGDYLLCDLQGGIYQQEAVITDPVILSKTREYGVTDLGPEGISSFFSQHTCNPYCHPNWIKPNRPVQHFHPLSGTTMVARPVPTAQTRPANTRYFG